MSQFLAELLRREVKLSEIDERLLTTSIRQMPRPERKQLYNLLKERPEISACLEGHWVKSDNATREDWLNHTASSIVDKVGDRDTLDKIAGRLIGNLKVYNRVQKFCDERKVILKASASEGGCTIILIIATIIIGLFVIIRKSLWP